MSLLGRVRQYMTEVADDGEETDPERERAFRGTAADSQPSQQSRSTSFQPAPDWDPRTDPLLEVRDLHVYFSSDDTDARAVDGVSLRVNPGEAVGIVGESGSGKTVTAEALARLHSTPPAYVPTGEITYKGRSIMEMDDATLRQLRGSEIGYIFQNPEGALNPVLSIEDQIIEAVRTQESDLSRTEAQSRAIELLTQVGIGNPTERLKDAPHEFSGGQKQRILIAIALASQPDLLIADEPTTAVDVTVQAQLLDLLDDLADEFNMAVLFVTHDLGVVARIAERVVVMYSGKVMETGPVETVLTEPAHPYTQALLACLPGRGERSAIPGTLPSVYQPPDGCRFADRCEYAASACRSGDQPPLADVQSAADSQQTHTVSCVYYQDSNSTVLPSAETPQMARDAYAHSTLDNES